MDLHALLLAFRVHVNEVRVNPFAWEECDTTPVLKKYPLAYIIPWTLVGFSIKRLWPCLGQSGSFGL